MATIDEYDIEFRMPVLEYHAYLARFHRALLPAGTVPLTVKQYCTADQLFQQANEQRDVAACLGIGRLLCIEHEEPYEQTQETT